jgi:flavin-dependent dehydrogenase
MKGDVAVIGTSTAGLYSAAKLAEKGLDVAVVEKNSRLDQNRRTYIVTPALKRVLPELDPSLILNRITTMAVAAGGSEVRIELSEPDLIVERLDLRRKLISRVQELGVEIYWGLEFQDFKSERDRLILDLIGEESRELIEVSSLIGADGVFSQVRKSSDLPPVPAVPLLQAEVKLPDNWNPGLTKVWFHPEETPYFYWLIPESNQTAVVGLIAEQGGDIRFLLDQFLERHGFQAEVYQSGQAALHHPRLRNQLYLKGGQVFLVGDAAGQVKVTTVGGTVTGFRGAQAVLEQILKQGQARQTARSLKQELDLHVWIRKLLERMRLEDYRKMVELISPEVKQFLAVNDRDRMRKQFWKLPFLQPGFIPLGLKLLLRSDQFPQQ